MKPNIPVLFQKTKNENIIIPLGLDCEPAFKLSFYKKDFDSYPFAWSYPLDREKMASSLADLSGLLEGDPFQFFGHGRMLAFSKYRVSFHIRLSPDSEAFTPVKSDELEELKSRLSHLIQKQANAYASGKPLVFIMKIHGSSFDQDKHFLFFVEKTLQSQCKGSFCFLPVFATNEINPKQYRNLTTANTFPVFVKTFWPFEDQSNVFKGDRTGWLRILKRITKGSAMRYWYSTSFPIRFILSPWVKIRSKLRRKQR